MYIFCRIVGQIQQDLHVQGGAHKACNLGEKFIDDLRAQSAS